MCQAVVSGMEIQTIKNLGLPELIELEVRRKNYKQELNWFINTWQRKPCLLDLQTETQTPKQSREDSL